MNTKTYLNDDQTALIQWNQVCNDSFKQYIIWS